MVIDAGTGVPDGKNEGSQGNLSLREYWYIACASSRLGSKALAARVLDYDLVLFRGKSLKPFALIDRCCHRGVQLSLGTVNDGRLSCRYHGWRYDGSGRCVHIPSLIAGRDIPSGYEVSSFPCLEQDGYVWVWMGEPGFETQPLRGIAEFQRHRWRQGSMAIRCDAMKMIENNLDWCHPYFTHPWTHGQFFSTRFRGFREQNYEMRLTENGLIVFAPATTSETQSIPECPIVSLHFSLPDRVRVEFRKPFHMIIWMHFVPTGIDSCRQEWMITKLLPLGRRTSWSNRQPRIFKQDKKIMESAQPWYTVEGYSFERSVEADAATLLARKIVGLAARKEWDCARMRLPERRVVRVRA